MRPFPSVTTDNLRRESVIEIAPDPDIFDTNWQLLHREADLADLDRMQGYAVLCCIVRQFLIRIEMRRFFLLMNIIAVILAPESALAQREWSITPKEPASEPTPAIVLPKIPPPLPASDAVLVRSLKGLVFLPASQQAGPSEIATSGIDATRVSRLSDPDFLHPLARYLGHPLTNSDIDAIVAAAATWYQEHGEPFVSVTLPLQDFSDGVVLLVVAPLRLGAVHPEGNRWFSSGLLVRQSDLELGQILTLPAVRSSVDRLNDNPFRTVKAIFGPGASPGTTNLALQTEDRLPVRVYSSFDNQGTSSLGRDEWAVGATWGNVAGLGHSLSYQFTRSLSGLYNAHALTYTAPLPWLDTAVISASQDYERADSGPDAHKTGHSDQASLRYVHNLQPHDFSAGVSLRHGFQIGYDFKRSDDNLPEGGDLIFQPIEINQFPFIYDATLTDPWGQTVLQNILMLSPGALTGDNSKQAFRQVMLGSSGRYAYDNVSLIRTTSLPRDLSWIARVQGQVATDNLMYTEQFELGGVKSVRGYAPGTADGSQGLLVNNEVWSPVLHLGKHAPWNLAVEDAEQIGFFLDYGHVSQRHPIPGTAKHTDLASVGPALHVTADRYVDLTFDAGWQLRTAPGTHKRGVFCDIVLIVGY